MSVTGCRSAGLLLHERAEMHTSKSELRRERIKEEGSGRDKRISHLTPHKLETLPGICRMALQNPGSERGAGRCGYHKGRVGMERSLELSTCAGYKLRHRL